MAKKSISNILDEAMAALKQTAARSKRSAKPEDGLSISNHARLADGKGFGSLLHEKYGGVIDDNDVFPRDRAPAYPIKLT